MGKGDRIGIMLDMNPGIIEIFSDGNDIPGEGAIRHVAFAPKLRGKEIYGKLRRDLSRLFSAKIKKDRHFDGLSLCYCNLFPHLRQNFAVGSCSEPQLGQQGF